MLKTYYLDDNNNIVEKEKSTHLVIQEFDANGNLINETFGFTENQINNNKNYNEETYEFSPEINEILNNYTDGKGNYMFRK